MAKDAQKERFLNIIRTAFDAGFDLNVFDRIFNVADDAIDYLLDNAKVDRIEECREFNGSGHTQYATWDDAKGYDWWASGEIVRYDAPWSAAELESGKKVFRVATVIDTDGKLVQLVHTVHKSI